MPRRPHHHHDRAVFPRTVVFPLPRGPLHNERAVAFPHTASSSRNQSAPIRIATPDQTSKLLEHWKEVKSKLNGAESDQMMLKQRIATAKRMMQAYKKDKKIATKAEREASEMVKEANQSLKTLEHDLKGYNILTISSVNDLNLLKSVYAQLKLRIQISGKLSATKKALLVKTANAQGIEIE